MSNAVEDGMRIRATIVEARRLLDTRNWEEPSREHMTHLWMTDCESLEEHLTNPTLAKISDKRLAVDLAALRQLIWQKDGTEVEDLDKSMLDQIRWIDTSKMLVDPKT